jgi:hypothetical protein
MKDTTDVVIKGKRFWFERIIDNNGTIMEIRLTEFGKYPDEIEMLEAFDFKLIG